MTKSRPCVCVLVVLLVVAVTTVWAQTTEFVYQGKLQNASVPANGNFDFEFLLFDALTGGNQIGSTLTKSGVAVADGIFSTKLDFGANFPGTSRFLEIHTRQTGGGAFTPLTPRQSFSSEPYAIRALTVTGPITGANAAQTLLVTNSQPGITDPSPTHLPPAALRSEATATNDSNAGLIGIGDGTTGIGVIGVSTGIAPVAGKANAIGVLGLATATSGKSFGISGQVSSPDGIAVQADSSNGAALFVGSNDSTGDVFIVGSQGGVIGHAFFNADESFAADSVGNLRAKGINVGPPNGGNDTFVVQPDGTTSAHSLFVNGTTLTASGTSVGVSGNLTVSNNFTITTPTLHVTGGANFDNGEQVTGNLQVNGSVSVQGNLMVNGTKNAVATLPDGRHVLLYAVESPENWFEDFGTIRLRDGRAVVKIDKMFSQTSNTAIPYKVFLTPSGNCRGLFVTRKTADSFEVRELGGGRSNISFDYRIIARRKGYENVRFAPAPPLPSLNK